MSQPTVSHFTLSFIWIETNLTLFTKPDETDTPMSFLANIFDYVDEFKEAQHCVRHNIPRTITMPWFNPKGQHFWTRYLDGTPNVEVNERNERSKPGRSEAWENIVPFRATLPLEISSSLPGVTYQFEAFFYPHAVAFTATLEWKSDDQISLEELTKLAIALRREPVYTANWHDKNAAPFFKKYWAETPASPNTLNQLADRCKLLIRRTAFGEHSQTGQPTNLDPFSVITIQDGRQVELWRSIESNSLEQKTLHTLTNWQPSREGAANLQFNNFVYFKPGKEAGNADAVYSQTRGRAIWYPSRFLSNDDTHKKALRCYHRNIMFSALQTESLYGLVDTCNKKTPGSEHPELIALSKYAAGLLGRLYGGQKNTYRSKSVQRQIEQNEWTEGINQLRTAYNMSELHI